MIRIHDTQNSVVSNDFKQRVALLPGDRGSSRAPYGTLSLPRWTDPEWRSSWACLVVNNLLLPPLAPAWFSPRAPNWPWKRDFPQPNHHLNPLNRVPHSFCFQHLLKSVAVRFWRVLASSNAHAFASWLLWQICILNPANLGNLGQSFLVQVLHRFLASFLPFLGEWSSRLVSHNELDS